jgi:hypothetical protein
VATTKEYFKTKEDELVVKFEKEFPKMIEKGQCIWIEPIVKHMPKVINRLQEKWEIEFKYDEETGADIIFMCPKFKKT